MVESGELCEKIRKKVIPAQSDGELSVLRRRRRRLRLAVMLHTKIGNSSRSLTSYLHPLATPRHARAPPPRLITARLALSISLTN